MKNTDFVTHFFDGLDAKGQAYLNYYFTREMMKEQFVRRTEMEKVKILYYMKVTVADTMETGSPWDRSGYYRGLAVSCGKKRMAPLSKKWP